jgi:hypothetical protein
MAVVSGAFLAVSLWCMAALAGEGDWFYDAADIMARFERLGGGGGDEARVQFLKDVTAFGAATAETARAARGRKAFSLWMAHRIHAQMRDDVAASKDAEALTQALESMPTRERTAFRALFTEKTEDRGVPTRKCDIRIEGTRVRVDAVGWPIADLAERLAGARNKTISIPPAVCGFVDFRTEDWTDSYVALQALCEPNGLSVMYDKAGRLEVSYKEPSYVSSIGEMADKRLRIPVPDAQARGIARGIVIYGGHYLPPPYQVDRRIVGNRAELIVNGLPVINLARPLDRATYVPPADGRCKDSAELNLYVIHRYNDVRVKQGDKAAAKVVAEILDSHKNLVKSYDLTDGGDLTVHSVGGRFPVVVTLYDEYLEAIAKGEPLPVPDRTRELQRRFEEALNGDGLVIVDEARGFWQLYSGTDGRSMAQNLCDAMLEVERARRRVGDAFGRFGSRPEGVPIVNNVFLNLRYRELTMRLRQEAVQAAGEAK